MPATTPSQSALPGAGSPWARGISPAGPDPRGALGAEVLDPGAWGVHERLLTRRVRMVVLVLLLIVLVAAVYGGYRVRQVDAELQEFSLRVVPLQQILGQLQRALLEERLLLRPGGLRGADGGADAGDPSSGHGVLTQRRHQETRDLLTRAVALVATPTSGDSEAADYQRVGRLLELLWSQWAEYQERVTGVLPLAPAGAAETAGLDASALALERRLEQARLLFEVYAKSKGRRIDALGDNALTLIAGITAGQFLIAALLGLYLIGSINRISARQRLLEQRDRRHRDDLAHLSRINTVGGLAAGLAHELNQPIQSILLRADTALMSLRPEPAGGDRLGEDLHAIAAQANRAGQILSQLRSFIARRETTRTPVDLNQQVHAAVALLRGAGRFEGVRVEARLDPAAPEVLGDPVQFQQVLLNLLQNADDAIHAAQPRPEPGCVTVQTRRAVDGGLVLSVTDNGLTMTPDQVQETFRPFFTTKPDGLGIGLVITRSLIEAVGGTLLADPNPDRGMVFTVRLPAPSTATTRPAEPRPWGCPATHTPP